MGDKKDSGPDGADSSDVADAEASSLTERSDGNVVHVDFRARAMASRADDAEEENRAAADERGERVGTPPEASKLECFSGMIDHGLVMVTFDTRAAGVDVPEKFRGTPQLHLNFSLRFRVPDFDYDEAGVRGSLSFDSGDHYCVIPWDAVYGLTSETLDERLAFPDSFPAELLALLPQFVEDEGGEGPEPEE